MDPVYHSAIGLITASLWHSGLDFFVSRRDRHGLLFIYKALYGHLPEYLTSLLNMTTNHYQTRFSDWLMLDVPRVNSKIGKTSFSFCAAHSWNTIQQTLKLSSLISIGQFQNMIKNHYVHVCNCFWILLHCCFFIVLQLPFIDHSSGGRLPLFLSG